MLGYEETRKPLHRGRSKQAPHRERCATTSSVETRSNTELQEYKLQGHFTFTLLIKAGKPF